MPFPNPNKHTRQKNNQRLPMNGVAGKEPRGTRADRQHRRGPARPSTIVCVAISKLRFFWPIAFFVVALVLFCN